jgi:hypothetical protein
MSTWVLSMHLAQKRLKVVRALPIPHLENPVAYRKIHAAKYCPSRIPAAQKHLCWHAAQRPHSAQRWKEEQIGFILYQHDAVSL